jgi:phosphoglycolate phosphatase
MFNGMNRSKQEKITALIFDFDGTIADSAEIFIESLAEVLRRSAFTEHETRELSHLNLQQLSQKFHVKKWQLPLISYRGRKKILTKMHRVEIFKGMSQAIEKLAKDYSLYILSSNSKPAIESFLDKYKLRDYFKDVYAGTSLAAKAKRLQKLVLKESVQVGRCIYIGDEVRDVEAAKRLSMKCVAVGWGYSSKKALLEMKPDKFCDKPVHLINAINSLD